MLAWKKDAVMYEVKIKQYSKVATFKAVEKNLQRLKDFDIEILWLRPIRPIRKAKRKGGLSFYYAGKYYKAVKFEFETLKDFKRLVDALPSL